MRPIVYIMALLGAFLISSSQGNADDASESTVWNTFFGQTYTSVIREEALRKCPAWSETAENPPVSVRKALRLADARREKLVHDTPRAKWHREWIMLEDRGGGDLEPSKRSCWRIHYDAHLTSGGESAPDAQLDLFVLMDGTVVDPVVTNEKAKDE